jgi:hypothetical protein
MAVVRLDQWPINAPIAKGQVRLIPIWEQWFTALVIAVNGTIKGEGSPEGVVTAEVGTLYRRIDPAAGARLWVKETGPAAPLPPSNTGWVAK